MLKQRLAVPVQNEECGPVLKGHPFFIWAGGGFWMGLSFSVQDSVPLKFPELSFVL